VDADPEARLRDAEIRDLGLAPAKVRRVFKREFGLTFQAYARARRLGRAFDAIKKGAALDDVILGHGFESHSGFREAFFKRFGTPPGRTASEAAAGRADYVRLAWIETPLGPMVAGATADGVCLLEFSDRRMIEAQFAMLGRRVGLPLLPGENRHLERLRAELEAYFRGALRRFTVPLVAPGTPFQRRVWGLLRAIPYGATRSYEDVARELGAPGAGRAVGRANGLNRIAILIPCHRVLNKSGDLGGYGGGLWRKRRLLDLERGGGSGRDGAVRSGGGRAAGPGAAVLNRRPGA